MTADLDQESTCYTTILALLTLAVAAFAYRFLGPDQTTTKEPIIEEHVETDEQVQPDEPEAQESDEPEAQSSDGSDFETINPSDVPELVEDIIPQEAVAVEEVPVVEEIPIIESAEEIETEEDLVKTMELDARVEAALDDYLGRDQPAEIESEPENEPVEELGSKDIPEVIELIEKKEEQIQESEIVIEPIITPVDIGKVDLEIEKSEFDQAPESEQQFLEDLIIPSNLADQTIMTPMAPKHAVDDNGLEDIVEPIKLDLEESQLESEPIEDIERKIENVAEQLIADTLGQIKSNVNIITQDGGDLVKEEKIIPKTVVADDDEKKARTEQLTQIADLIAKTPGMAGEGLDVDDQAKMYLE